MTEQSPPPFEQNPDYGAASFRQLMQFMAGIGKASTNLQWPTSTLGNGAVMRPSHMKVTVSSGVTMSVAAGGAMILGSRTITQGAYFGYNSGAKSVILDAAPGSPNSRRDYILARIYDTEKGESTDTFSIEKLSGSAGPSPSPPSLSGIEDFFVLAEILVPFSGACTVTDRRRVNQIDGVPIGTIQDYCGAGSAPPHGFLLCDSHQYVAADYPDLFEVIGYTFGGSGANFRVPDLRGRATFGPDNMNPYGSVEGDGGNTPSSGVVGDAPPTGQWSRYIGPENLPSTTLHTSTTAGTDHTHLAAGSATGLADGVVKLGSGSAFDPTPEPLTTMPPFIVTNKIIRAY